MIQDRPNWLSRPLVIGGIAFLAGAAIAGAVVAVVLLSGDDGDDNGGSVDGVVTSTVQPTGSPSPGTGTPAGTAAPLNPRNADDALANYIQQELDQTYIGPCPQETAGEIPTGLCSIELYRSAELATFMVGPPFSEGIGEAVLTPSEDGVWTVAFVPLTNQPPVLGGQAVVVGAGDCVNFRSGPGTSSQTLTCQLDGTRAEVIGGPQTVDNVIWWQLRDLGWASGQYLQAAP